MQNLREQFKNYADWLDAQELSVQTRRTYRSRVKSYISFLSCNSSYRENVFSDLPSLQQAMNEYKNFLKKDQGIKPASINTSLSAIEHFNSFIGLEGTTAKYEPLLKSSPKTLSDEEVERLVQAVHRCQSRRDKAIAFLFLYAGIRISECAALNVTDVMQTATEGAQLLIPADSGSSNGGRHRNVTLNSRYRIITLNSVAEEALTNWLTERNQLFAHAKDPALFLAEDRRLSVSGIDFVIRRIGIKARMVVSAQLLRQTFLAKVAKASGNPAVVAYIGGLRSVESAQQYFVPSNNHPSTIPPRLAQSVMMITSSIS